MITESEQLIIIANAVICIALIPSIFSKDKPHWATSLMNATLTTFYLIAYYKINFTTVMIINTIIGIFWLILFFQKLTTKA